MGAKKRPKSSGKPPVEADPREASVPPLAMALPAAPLAMPPSLIPPDADPEQFPRLVSVVIPTWNGAEELARLLPVLESQVLDGGLEVCAVDSGSTDGTVELLEAHDVCVEHIRKEDFRHGPTRNLCAARAHGEYLIFLSQDVLPADEHFVAGLLEAFEDERVAGVYSRVLPHPDDDPLTARTVLDLPEASVEGWVRDLDEVGNVWDMGPEHRANYLRFNNVASAIRKSVFDEMPFPEISFAEDFAWAARALTAGWRIAYAPKSVVYHAHSYSLSEAFERYRVDAHFHRAVHGWRMRPSLLSAARGILFEVREDARYLTRNPVPGRLRHLLRSPGLRAAQVLGQFVGSRQVSAV